MKKILLFLSVIISINSYSQNTVYFGNASGELVVALTGVPAGNTITNTTTETTFAECQPVIPPSMWYVGRVFHLQVAGIFSTAVVVPSITGKVKLGSVVIGTTGSVTTAGSISNKGWSGYCDIICTSIGVSGTIEIQGQIAFQTGVGVTVVLPIVNTAPVTIDMTVSETMSLTAQWGAASTSNTLQLRQFILHE